MSIEILQERELKTGWINIRRDMSWPSIGVLPSPRSKSIHGIAFTSIGQIDEAILFLKKARREMIKADLEKRRN